MRRYELYISMLVFYMYYAATMIVEYVIREFLDDYNDSSRRGGGGRGGLVQQRFDSLGTPVERYFEAWNRRNVPLALSCFDDNVYYDDTQFSKPFDGKAKLADHSPYVSDCLPESYYFVLDELSVGRVQD